MVTWRKYYAAGQPRVRAFSSLLSRGVYLHLEARGSDLSNGVDTAFISHLPYWSWLHVKLLQKTNIKEL
jgi:hypothetical protein